MCILHYLEGNLYIDPTILSPAIILLFCALCCCLAHVVFLITIYVHGVTLRSLLLLRGAVCLWGLQARVGAWCLLLGGAGLGTTSKECGTFARGGMVVFGSCDIVGAVKTSQILPR